MSGEYILVVTYFVMSIFGYQLGQPVQQYIPYPNLQLCQQYGNAMQNRYQLDSEFTMGILAQCVSKEEYDAWLQSMQPPTEEETPE